MRFFSAVAGVLLAGICVSLSASAPTFLPSRLVVDLNSIPIAIDSAPTAACTQGSTAYFQATDENAVTGLWKSDGTSAGTTLVKQIGPAGAQTYIHCLGVSASGLAYFWGSDATHGQQLWRSDGTATGTLMVSGFILRSFATPTLLAFLPNGSVIFQVDDQVYGNELWVSDGTTAGTHIIVDLTPGTDGSYFIAGATYGGDFYFGFNGNPWKTDGTAAGTQKIADIGTPPGSYSPSQFVALSNGVLFVGTSQGPGGEFWFIDGSTATRVTNSFPGTGAFMAVSAVQSLGSKATFFVTDQNTQVTQLWVTDATLAGTKQIKVSASLHPVNFFANLSGHVVFTARSGSTGLGIWGTDGTEGGTQVLNGANPASADLPMALSYITAKNFVYALATSSTNAETWVTDGTVSGTHKLGNFSPGNFSDGLVMAAGDAEATYLLTTTGAGAVSGSRATLRRLDGQSGALSVVTQLDVASPQSLTPLNGKVLFTNTTPAVGQEPWVSDGTASGTHLLRDIAPTVRNGDSIPFVFSQLPGFALMRANDGVHGVALWRTDGTASGTKMVSSVVPEEDLSAIIPAGVVNGGVVFAGNDGVHGIEPWVTDGTPAGTLMLADIAPGGDSSIPNSSYPAQCGMFVSMGGYAYFGARFSSTGGGLWRTDGTPAGTTYIASFRWSRNFFGGDVCVIGQMNGYVFFLAETPPNGDVGLWKTDGTAAGTTQVSDTASGPFVVTSKPVVSNGYLYFVASNGSGSGIFRSDGTTAGTVPFVVPASPDANSSGPYQPIVAGNYVFYVVCSASNVCTLYSADQTTGQRTALAETANSLPPAWTSLGNKVIFQGKSSGAGVEPWVTDGTPAGTRMLLDIIPGSTDSSPVSFINFNGLMYFTIQRPDPGQLVYEYWRTDGTTAGTVRIDNVAATPIPNGLNVMAGVVGQHLFFEGGDATHGWELWSLDNAQPVLNADAGTTPSDVPVTIDVLANDVDSDGAMDPSSTQIVQQPTHGTATVAAGTGAIQYTATAGYVGPDSLTYMASDVQHYAGAPATVSLAVTEPVGNGGGSGSGGGSGGGGSGGSGSGGSGSGGSGSGGSGSGSGPGGGGSSGTGDGSDGGGGKGGGGGGAIEPYILLMLTIALLGRGIGRTRIGRNFRC